VTPSFWRGRRVLLTGHTGFKGSWLSLWLQQLGAKVTGYALDPPTTPSLFAQARVGEGMASEHGDLVDFDRLQALVRAAAPEVVFHLAAQPIVRASYDDPRGTYATNVMGTVNVLEAIRLVGGVKAAVIVTTDKVYENREWVWAYRETDRLGGTDPYASSKAAAELATAAYRCSFFAGGVPALASARAGNVIGGGDWAQDRIVPDTMRAFLEGQEVLVRNPASVRPWQYVLDALAGYLCLAERLASGAAAGEAWNFGPPEELVQPVSALVTRLASLWGAGAGWTSRAAANDVKKESRLLQVDSSKARALLGWRPVLGLDDALAWIVEWHRAVGGGADARALSDEQIVRYRRRQEEACSPAGTAD